MFGRKAGAFPNEVPGKPLQPILMFESRIGILGKKIVWF
jgi:hypothetical protein